MSGNVKRKELLELFSESAGKRLGRMTDVVNQLSLGTGPVDVKGLLREIHTLKGETGMLGLKPINSVCTHFESFIISEKEKDFDDWDQALLRRGIEMLKAMTNSGKITDENYLRQCLQEYNQYFNAPSDKGKDTEPEKSKTPIQPLSEEDFAEELPEVENIKPVEDDEINLKATLGPAGDNLLRDPFVRIGVADFEALTTHAVMLQQTQEQISQSIEQINRHLREVKHLLWQKPGNEELGYNPLDVISKARDKVSAVYRMVSKSRDLGINADLFASSVAQQVRMLRLIDIKSVFEKYAAYVNDLSYELKKTIKVVVDDGLVKADKHILEQVNDPLLHLIRNCADHGLESEDERQRVGKRGHGTITLRSRQFGSQVEVSISDDGRGINTTEIARTLVSKGLVSKSRVESMSHDELVYQIFRSGFSTKKQVTAISGRGVGMDVVKHHIESVGGIVSVNSEQGTGTTFTLRLPVSVSVSSAMVVEVSGILFAIPSTFIESVHYLQINELVENQGKVFLDLGGEQLPMLSLEQLLNLPVVKVESDSIRGQATHIDVLVVTDGLHRVALRVPRFIANRHMVQNTLNMFMAGAKLITGTTVDLGGAVVQFLNVGTLLGLAINDIGFFRSSSTDSSTKVRTILAVDDAEVTLKMVERALVDLGYRAVTFNSAKAAIEHLKVNKVDLIISDWEMPIMHGSEFLVEVRKSQVTKDLPVIVLTTRFDTQTENEARELGASEFLSKNAFDEENLDAAIKKLLNER